MSQAPPAASTFNYGIARIDLMLAYGPDARRASVLRATTPTGILNCIYRESIEGTTSESAP
jgi:hypothetical protein